MDTTGNGLGDLKGIMSKLDYISDIGIDYVWLSPINESPQNDNGYDISDYYTIDPIYGNVEIYQEFIKEANNRGMKVMLDLVLNHTSDQHEWFKKALSGDEYYKDFYVWSKKPNDLKGFFWNDAWEYCEEIGEYYLHLFDKSQPDLNWHNKNVRDELYKMINYWIDLGVEGFRLDVIDLIGKEPEKYITGKGPKYLEYMQELNKSTFKDRYLTVGECWNSSLGDAISMCNVGGLSEIFHFSHISITSDGEKWTQKKLDKEKFISQIEMWQNEYKGNQTVVMNNHDIPRLMSIWLDDKEYRYESATCLANFFTCLKGTQYIYQGEEIGMTNAYKNNIEEYKDVETFNKYNEYKRETNLSEQEIMNSISKVSRDNARVPMQWTKDGGFTEGTPWIAYAYNYKYVNVETDLSAKKSIYKYYQDIIKFKKDNFKNFVEKEITNCGVIEDKIVFYKKDNMSVYSNFSNEEIKININGKIKKNNYDVYDGTLYPYQSIIVEEDRN